MIEEAKINNKAAINEALSQMEMEDLLAIQREVKTVLRKKRKKPRGLVVSAYIQKEQLPYVPLVTDWLFQRKYIKKKTYYNVASFAIHTLIDNIIATIKEESGQRGMPPVATKE
jgi:hypothetical protein